jgi:thioredoxin-related protein
MKNLATLVLLLFVAASTFAQIRPVKKDLKLENVSTNTVTLDNSVAIVNSPEKQAALNFGKQMIQAYFDQNCSAISDQFAAQMIIMESGATVTVDAQLKQAFCNESPLRQDMQLNFSMYEANYTPEVLDFNEYSTKYPNHMSTYNLQAGDYFFNGVNLNNGGTSLFRYSDMATFILRKTATGFEIIAM